jgi:hypothetical protein
MVPGTRPPGLGGAGLLSAMRGESRGVAQAARLADASSAIETVPTRFQTWRGMPPLRSFADEDGRAGLRFG